jgi:HEAT repeat protein
MRSEEIIRRIRSALADEELIVRRSAACALARIGFPARESIPDLRKALREAELLEDAIQALLWI